MYTNDFTYHRPRTLDEAKALFGSYEDPAFVSGGHTLLPTMKNRLAAPEALIDLRSIPDLRGIGREADRLVVGAAMTHYEVSTSKVIADAIPALALLAGSIADVQVRHLGTIGGSLANNDPAADYPSAVLALDAEVITDQRVLPADSFFEGLFATALEPGEIIKSIAFPVPEIAGYGKFCSQASRYALAGAFVSRTGGSVRIGVTGAGSDGVFRWREAEEVLARDFSARSLEGMTPDEDGMISDIHGAADYRAHLVGVVTRHAVENMGSAYVR